MARVESNGEGKLRAACDRCHELKNRCTRTGGPESRCVQCERLDIDCVYNTSARMGRPRGSRQLPDKSNSSDSGSGDSHTRHATKRRAVQSRQQRTANQASVDHVDLASGGSPGSLEPVLGLLNPVSPEGTYICNGPALWHWQMARAKEGQSCPAII